MRVLLLTQPTQGGVFRHVLDLASGLTRSGHEVLIGAPVASLPDGVNAELVTIPMDRALSPQSDLRAVASLIESLHRTKPDVVHAHSSKAGGTARLARITSPRLAVVYTPHGYAFASHFRPVQRDVYRAMEAILAPIASRVVCVCEAERRLAASIGPPSRTRVVYNGVIPPPLDGLDPPPDHSIVAMTRLAPGKGLETLLDAMPRILAAHPKARATILGNGPHRAELARRAEQLGVSGAVEFLTAGAAWTRVISGAAVFVHPSWAESFPYAILDAMAWGRPIVATDIGGIPEAIENGRCGVLVPPRDVEALASMVNALLADRARATALGRAARRRVETRFTLGRMVKGILDVYEEIGSTRRQRRLTASS